MISYRYHSIVKRKVSMNTEKSTASRESERYVTNGWIMLPSDIILILGSAFLIIYSLVHGIQTLGHPMWAFLIIGVLSEFLSWILLAGFFTLQPNEARVLLLFGAYKGTVRKSGFHWANPFYSRNLKAGGLPVSETSGRDKVTLRIGTGNGGKVSLRARTLNVEKLKVNDKRGNPIEIAAVVVWRVADTAQAVFDVDDYEGYVHLQSESALRHLASAYRYDDGEENEPTLRGNVDEISRALRQELQERLAIAGVLADEARLTNLSYAPEIAQVMLRRQQAEAVIAARQKIVHGAVSMVDMALKDLAQKEVVELDNERKAAMVSNLMVVLCSESEVHPVVNTGTLYT
jgi:regulator of protease activity HflC (stomatin/prohibitin superfamily)